MGIIEKTKLGSFFNNRREKGLPDLPVMSVTINNGLIERSTVDRKTDTSLTSDKHLLTKKGDIAYNMMRMWQGAFGLALQDGIVSPAYVVLAPKEGINSEFAYHWFKSPRMIYLFWAYSYGLTNDRLRLYYKDFAMIAATPPPLDHQRVIATTLTTWDVAIEKTKWLIAMKEKVKMGLMQRLLTGKHRLKGFSKSWKEYHLGDLFKVRSERDNEHLPLLSITRKAGVIPREEVDRKDNSSADRSKYLRICPGDIGYNTMRMWQGISAYSNYEGIVSPAYTITIPEKGVDGEFIAYLFKLPKTIHLFYRYSQGLTSDTWNLKFRHFREIKVSIPEIDEQKAISQAFKICDAELFLLRKKLDALQKQKRGLVQKLLDGQWRGKVTSENK